ncbi:MAG: QueT transporter family protein, partial [Acholeplasmatales bacterium]|nr:QueT transporter family protein [Acholeplasmatales bacterium]
MKNKHLNRIVRLSVVAAIYVALTLALYPLSYGAVQFRISEALMMLVAYNPIYSISLIIGCLISNLASPMGVVDIVFGTLATVLSCIMYKFKNKYIASLIPSIVNAIVIGLELKFVYNIPFYLGSMQVFVGEFVVVSLYGVTIFKGLEKNENICNMLEISPSKQYSFEKYLSKYFIFSLALSILGIILFFKLGIYNYQVDEEYDVYSISRFSFTNLEYRYLIILLIIPIISTFISMLIKKPLGA